MVLRIDLNQNDSSASVYELMGSKRVASNQVNALHGARYTVHSTQYTARHRLVTDIKAG